MDEEMARNLNTTSRDTELILPTMGCGSRAGVGMAARNDHCAGRWGKNGTE